MLVIWQSIRLTTIQPSRHNIGSVHCDWTTMTICTINHWHSAVIGWTFAGSIICISQLQKIPGRFLPGRSVWSSPQFSLCLPRYLLTVCKLACLATFLYTQTHTLVRFFQNYSRIDRSPKCWCFILAGFPCCHTTKTVKVLKAQFNTSYRVTPFKRHFFTFKSRFSRIKASIRY